MTAAEQVLDSAAEVVAAYLTERIGLSVAGPRRAHLLGQIADAMARVRATSGEWYCARLEKDEDSFDELVARVTVGESYFFREPGQLEVLRSTILPEHRSARGPGAALRLWSAGCAIGQEAYTLAIVLEEEGLAASARIVATDISREALRVATAGVYGSWSLRAVTDRQREAYFHPVAMGYRVDERFARSITFRPLNLLDPTNGAPRDIDVILCRNVLIYFAPEAVARAARHLADALAPGGWLVTGSSDPPLEGVAELEPTATAAGLVYRRSSAAARDGAAARGTVETVAARRRPSPPAVVPVPAPNPAAVRPVRPAAPSPAKHDETGDEAVRTIRALGGAGNLVQQSRHGAVRDRMAVRGQCRRELPSRLARPAQGRLRVAAGLRVNEGANAAGNPGSFSTALLRPPPARRDRPSASSVGRSSSATAFVTVDRESPIAAATVVTPPQPNSRASTPNSSRR